MWPKQLLRYGCAAFSALLLSACSTQPPLNGGLHDTGTSLVWPAPPATARIRFVRSIATPRDMGIKRSLFRRMMDRFTGGSEMHFLRPSGVAEREDVIYVADPDAHMLWILDPATRRTTGVRKAGKTALISPVAVAVRTDGAVFVADSELKQVFLFSRKGKYLGIAAATGLKRPAGLAYDDSDARLYVADSAGQHILVFNANGEKLFAWGQRGTAAGEFNYPTHLAFAPDGELLVTDALNFRIQSFDRNGKFLWQFGQQGDTSGSFAAPKGVAEDSGGHVYVVDALFETVQLFRKDGTLLTSFGSRGDGPGQFWLPGGIFIDDKDRIFVADSYNHRIQVFQFLHTPDESATEYQPSAGSQ